MPQQATHTDLRRVVRRAVERIRLYGVDGPRPIEELEVLLERKDGAAPALEEAVRRARGEELVAAIHLVALLRCAAVLATVRRRAFGEPAPLEAKREAVAAHEACGVPPEPEQRERLRRAEEFVRAPDAAGLQRLLREPRPWRLPALGAWLARARAAAVGLAEKALGTDPETDRLVLEWLGGVATEEAGRVVGRYLAGASGRERVKAARRAAHRLRSRGVPVPEPAAGKPAARFTLALEPGPVGEASAYVSSIDGRGARLVWILWPSETAGARLLQAVIDDVDGLREAEIIPVTRKEFRRHIEALAARGELLVSRVELAHAARLLAAAAARARASGRELPAAYREWLRTAREGLPEAEGASDPPARIYQRLQEAAVRDRPELLAASAELLREPPFGSWALLGELPERAAAEVRAAERSRLMIDEAQRRARIEAAMRGALEGLDAGERRRLRRRLEAMASMLWDQGRHELAERALAAAVGFTEVADLYGGHPLARALLERGVLLAYRELRRREREEERASRIVRP